MKQVKEFNSAPPVFFSNYDAPDNTSHAEFCAAAEKLMGDDSIVGCQRIGQVWRLYPATREIRANLVGKKLLIKGKSIPISSQNPLSNKDRYGNQVPSTRLTIDGLYAEVSSVDLEGYLLKAGAKLTSPIFWERARFDGAFTKWLTGRRFVWIVLPASPLPQAIKIGDTFVSLYYRERPKGAPVCYSCGEENHRRGDPVCRMARSKNPWAPPVPKVAESARATHSESEMVSEDDESSLGSDDDESEPETNKTLTGAEKALTGNPVSNSILDEERSSADVSDRDVEEGTHAISNVYDLSEAATGASGPPVSPLKKKKRKDRKKSDKGKKVGNENEKGVDGNMSKLDSSSPKERVDHEKTES